MGIKERKQRERERRRQQIMVAAKRVFVEKGIGKATMEDIAKEAELSPGTLYLYFKNKDDLYASLSIRVLSYLLIRIEHTLELDVEPEEKYKALVDVMYDAYQYDPLIMINMFHLQSSEMLKSLSPEILDEILDLSRKCMRGMADIFNNGIEKGMFVERNPIVYADIFWSIYSGVVLWEESKKIINADSDFLKPTLDVAFELFYKGILKDPE